MVIALRYLVRPMRVEDIPQVMEIERESFPTMWPPTAFRRELQQNRLAHYIVVVEDNPRVSHEHDDDERHGPIGRFLDEIKHILSPDDDVHLPPPEQRPELVVGFIGIWMMADEAHIVTIATRDSHRRRGIGEALLISAIETAQDRGQPLVTLEVRVSNDAAIALYEKYGFNEMGRRVRYYSDNHEDAYVLSIDSVLTRRYRQKLDDLREAHARRWGDFSAL
jgi:ribosomal-protein-alanine N-acetyltransferase